MHKKLIIIPSLIFNILLGAFMFVFGESDDSPGAQLLGLTAVAVGVAGLITMIRRKHALDSSAENSNTR